MINSKRKRVMSTEGVLAVLTDEILKENKTKLKKITRQELHSKQVDESSPEIVKKESPYKINKKIKITKEALDYFIDKHFTVISDDEADQFRVNAQLNQRETSSRSSSILSSSSSSSNMRQFERPGKKIKLSEVNEID